MVSVVVISVVGSVTERLDVLWSVVVVDDLDDSNCMLFEGICV